MPITRIDTDDILNGTILEEDVADGAISPVKADLTASWDFGQGTGSTLFYKVPTSNNEVAVKSYVDAAIAGITDPKDSVLLAASGNISLSGLQTIDGVATSQDDRILVFGQTSAEDNGLYAASTGSWPRTEDADSDPEVTNGLYTFVTSGSVWSYSGWLLCTPDPITVDTTEQRYVQINGLATITAGTGLIQSGNIINAGQGYGISLSNDAIGVDPAVVGDLTGTNAWTGPNTWAGASTFSDISGTLMKNQSGNSYLVGGDGVLINSSSGDQIILSSDLTYLNNNFADAEASYIVIGNTSSLPNERELKSGFGVDVIDEGINGDVKLDIDGSVIPVLSATNIFTGANTFTGASTFSDISGTLMLNAAGNSYLVEGTGIIVNSGSGDHIVIGIDTGSFQAFVSSTNADVFQPVGAYPETIFTSSNDFRSGSLKLWKKGMRMREGVGNDFTITDTNEVTFSTQVGNANISILGDYFLDG